MLSSGFKALALDSIVTAPSFFIPITAGPLSVVMLAKNVSGGSNPDRRVAIVRDDHALSCAVKYNPLTNSLTSLPHL